MTLQVKHLAQHLFPRMLPHHRSDQFITKWLPAESWVALLCTALPPGVHGSWL